MSQVRAVPAEARADSCQRLHVVRLVELNAKISIDVILINLSQLFSYNNVVMHLLMLFEIKHFVIVTELENKIWFYGLVEIAMNHLVCDYIPKVATSWMCPRARASATTTSSTACCRGYRKISSSNSNSKPPPTTSTSRKCVLTRASCSSWECSVNNLRWLVTWHDSLACFFSET